MNTEADLIAELVSGALRYASAEARTAYLDGAGPIDKPNQSPTGLLQAIPFPEK